VAAVVVAISAGDDLARLIESRDLPSDTVERLRACLDPVAMFPRIGRALAGRWEGFRVIPGPWPWMLVLYRYDDLADIVAIVASHDAREATSATSAP
jgi:plasmid stabilization system protein ParE